MSDHMADSAHRILLRRERENAQDNAADTRRRIDEIARDVQIKSEWLNDCDVEGLLIMAADFERVAIELRYCAERMQRATQVIADHIVEQARLRGHEL